MSMAHLGKIESFNRTLEVGIIKQLYGKKYILRIGHVHSKMLLFIQILMEVYIVILMVGHHFDDGLKKTHIYKDMLPFWSIVTARIPVVQQPAGSQRSSIKRRHSSKGCNHCCKNR